MEFRWFVRPVTAVIEVLQSYILMAEAHSRTDPHRCPGASRNERRDVWPVLRAPGLRACPP